MPYGNGAGTLLLSPRTVTLLGSDAVKTVITFSTGAKDVGGTFFSSTVEVGFRTAISSRLLH